MFDGAIEFNQPLEFNTGNVTNMVGMFYDTISFNKSLEFNTNNVTSMDHMFYNSGLKNIPHWYGTTNKNY